MTRLKKALVAVPLVAILAGGGVAVAAEMTAANGPDPGPTATAPGLRVSDDAPQRLQERDRDGTCTHDQAQLRDRTHDRDGSCDGTGLQQRQHQVQRSQERMGPDCPYAPTSTPTAG